MHVQRAPRGPTPLGADHGPRLAPATRLLWRTDRSVQLELGSRAVVVDGLAPEDIGRLAGRQPASPPVATRAADQPADHGAAVGALVEAGYLWPHRDDAEDVRLSPPVARLQAELAALTVRHGEAAADVLHARRDRAVAVLGDGRGGPQLAALLGAAGVGRVWLSDPGTVRLHQAAPGGVRPVDEGQSLAAATARATTAAAPEVDTTALPMGERPDLVVLAQDGPVDDERREALHARGCPHLQLRFGPGFGVVGPLVVPGLTACLRCTDLHRLDRDPAWTSLAVQLAVARRATAACEVALATTVTGIAALQALSFLDGEDPATIDGTLELHTPAWQVRRRTWPAHPDCRCGG
jgi:hypothetical protein